MDKDKYIGQLLDDRYEILEVIGIGGMAVVYKALCHRLNRLVAVKILKDEYSQDKEFRDRFHAESQAVAMLSHPNIVSIYDVSSSDEADYIVMELIDGISLKQYMEKKGVLNWKETLHFAIQIAKALEHAHGRGIVHRDIKPHNVMVLKNGSIKVADFGIAQVTSRTSTLTTEALGSVHYISPEQAKGGRVDNRSDVYSLGVVMYEMIAGRVPYDGDSPVNIAIQHINGGAQKPSQYNPNIPQGLEQIIRKAMALAPKDRYLTATAMLYDMDEFRKDPTMVFTEAPAAVDGATRAIPTDAVNELAGQQGKTIAERKADGKDDPVAVPKPPRRTPKPEPIEEEEEGRSRAATIAIASCVVVGIVALIIFFVLLAQGGLFTKTEMVSVPNLIGENYDTLRDYDGIEVVRQGGEYNDQYARGEIIYQYPLSGVQVKAGTKVFVKISLGSEPSLTMDDLVDLKADEAERFLNDLNIGLRVIRREENHSQIKAGNVTRTNPAKGDPLNYGQTVTIWISTGPEVIFESMLDVVGQSYDYAVSILEANGFKNIIPNPVNSDRPEGEVVGQSVEKYEKIDVTTEIVLDVSNGIPEEPDVTEPSEPDVTEPSEPEVTEPIIPEPSDPEPTQVTIDYVFVVPGRAESYQLSIKLGDTLIVENMTVESETTTVQLTLTGNGTQNYDLYIDGEYYATETVEFEPDD
ncbi:MAG: Stk1 family PASTA domain-containing Ser/Thr kinase [Oscillospiraceae bacterium]|nr:Stk1 family PASTA domain-containing Ser/Thr kinase [Oscillospiraceae bacterium]